MLPLTPPPYAFYFAGLMPLSYAAAITLLFYAAIAMLALSPRHYAITPRCCRRHDAADYADAITPLPSSYAAGYDISLRATLSCRATYADASAAITCH